MTVTRGARGALERSQGTLSGFAGFSFVEAAVLLVAVAVLVLTWARATERRFSLPFDDGTLVTAGAVWAGLLVIYRLFDRPSGDTGPELSTLVGLSWGIFATLLAVGLLLMTGLDQRRAALAERGRGRGPDQPDPADDRPVVDPQDVVHPPAASAPAAPVSRSWSYDQPGSELERQEPGAPPAVDEPAPRPAPRGPAGPTPRSSEPAPDGRPREASRPESPPRDERP